METATDQIDIHSRLTALEVKWDATIPTMAADMKTLKDGMEILVAEHNQRKGARKLLGILMTAGGLFAGWKLHGGGH